MGIAFSEARSAVTRFEVGQPETTGNVIRLHYAATGDDGPVYRFCEEIEIAAELERSPVVDGLVRLLALAASLSYFKAFAPITFAVPSGLTETERTFISQLITGGLGEFAIVNDLPTVLDPVIEAPAARAPDAPSVRPSGSRALVAVGGGKDSIVSIEALTSAGRDVGLFAINPRGPIEATARVAGIGLDARRGASTRCCCA